MQTAKQFGVKIQTFHPLEIDLSGNTLAFQKLTKIDIIFIFTNNAED